jgi:FMN phosphatase YigB (HAD superfamily)
MFPATIQAVLFDVYGTLLQGRRTADREGPMTEVARRFGLPIGRPIAPLWDAAVEQAHAQSPEPYPEIDARSIWQDVFPDLGDPDQLALAMEEAIHPVRPTPWAADLLEHAVRQGCRLGIVSNAQAYTKTLLARHFPTFWPRFEPCLCAFSHEHGIAKPDLRLFHHALRPLLADGLSPGQVLMTGDSDACDAQPAAQLGLPFLLVPNELPEA